jgi:hypothetical protein
MGLGSFALVAAKLAPTETFFYGALVLGAIFAVLLTWTLLLPPGNRRLLAGALTGASFLIFVVPFVVALVKS